jgi:hypothetical protein
MAILSTAVSAIGAMQQAQAQKAQAEYQAQVQRNNSIIASQNEADVVQRGEVVREVQRTRISQTIGAARAALGGNGLLVDEAGTSSVTLQEDLRQAGQMDIMTLRGNIEREARKARIQSINYKAQAGLFDMQAKSINPLLSGLAAGFGAANSSGLLDYTLK